MNVYEFESIMYRQKLIITDFFLHATCNYYYNEPTTTTTKKKMMSHFFISLRRRSIYKPHIFESSFFLSLLFSFYLRFQLFCLYLNTVGKTKTLKIISEKLKNGLRKFHHHFILLKF